MLADTLLREAAELTILVTSRQPLCIAGEHLWPVAPLPVPDPDEPLPARAAQRFAALQLFVDRAVAVDPGFALTRDNERDVVRICRQLDGIPLGIELGAVWLRDLSVPQVAERLNNRFGFLTHGSIAAAPRHRTLRATVEWSYNLCSTGERALWARASVFAGSLDLSGAEAVSAPHRVPPDDVLAAVAALVDKSVLLRVAPVGQQRYRLLETLREYGQERLRESGEEPALLRAHRDYYLAMAERLDAEWFGPDQLAWSARLHAEHDNLRAALRYCLTEPGEARTGMRMAEALWFFWVVCGHLREGRLWLDRTLAADPGPSRQRVRTLGVAGRVAYTQGDVADATTMLNEARDLAEKLGDEAGYARAIHGLAIVASLRNETDRMTEYLDEAAARYRALPEPDTMEPAIHMHRSVITAMALDPEHGIRLSRDYRRVSEASGDLWTRSYVDQAAAYAEQRLGHVDEAAALGRDCLRIKAQFGDLSGIALTIEFLAWVEAAAGNAEQAAVLLGAAWQTYRTFGLPLQGSPLFGEPHQVCEARLRRDLGTARFEAAFASGIEFTVEQAVAYALGEEPDVAAEPRGGRRRRHAQAGPAHPPRT